MGCEPYLALKDSSKRTVIARLRTSSHRLNNETGRYTSSNTPNSCDLRNWKKCCSTCTDTNMEDIISLPFSDPITEDEWHVLITCPLFHHIRVSLADDIKSKLMIRDPKILSELFTEDHVNSLATYVLKIFKVRFPKV